MFLGWIPNNVLRIGFGQCSRDRVRIGGWVMAVVSQLYKWFIFFYRPHCIFSVYNYTYNNYKIVIFPEKEVKGASSRYIG